MKSRTLVAISVGCPSGIGPEVAIKAALESSTRSVLVGDPGVILAELARLGVRTPVLTASTREQALRMRKGQLAIWGSSTRLSAPSLRGLPSPEAGAAQLAWVNEACDLVTSGVADALITGPVSKHAISTSGASGSRGFLGHTEHLAKRLKSPSVVMAFAGPRLVTSLVTTHLRLADVPKAITVRGVALATYHLCRFLMTLRKRSPRVAVVSLNPHAGESGLFGNEERTKIIPGAKKAIAWLEKEGLKPRIEVPVGAETAFRHAAEFKFDGVVAMYHDQATVPSKLLDFGKAVNVSLGLPIVRTSVDHGTGYDIAQRNRADAGAMSAAIDLAGKLARARAAAKQKPA